MTVIRLETDQDRIAHLILDKPGASSNVMDPAFGEDLARCLDELEAMPDLAGVMVRSEKSSFMAGGDLDLLRRVDDGNADTVLGLLNSLKLSFRRLELLHKPVVACLTGTALGGGFELALACSHRIVLDDSRIRLGLPEVTLGLLPAAGGTSRLVRLLGLEAAMPLLTEGRQLAPDAAEHYGLVHERAATPQALFEQAKAFIRTNPEVAAPWDQKGFKVPGGLPNQPRLAPMLSVAPAMIKQKTHGCYPAPVAVLAAAVEGASLDMDAAGRVENRYFMPLAKGTVAKNLITTLFFQKKAIDGGRNRPDAEAEPIGRVGILGAGMMGAGIAWACASKGIPVVLLDVDQSKAEQGKAYSEKLVARRVQSGRWTEPRGQAVLDAIQPTTDVADLAECDLVIEAVFEDRAVKAEITRAAEAVIGPNALLASNTSTLPISSLAEAVADPERFIGLHFFSPVDKMSLVEIIRGERSSDASLARAYDLTKQLGKTPIVVNDGRGFFTSRVFRTYTYEGLAMLAEGVPAAEIENAAWLAGFPVGPLAVMDEVSLGLLEHVRAQTRADLEAEGKTAPTQPGDAVLDRMLALERLGRSAGAGFYDYPSDGPKRLWPGLAEAFGGHAEVPLDDLKDRLLAIQALESVRILDEGILNSVAEANIGSLFGLGYPAWTGGVLQYINQCGLDAFVGRVKDLAERYGERFEPPNSLVERARLHQPYDDKDTHA